MSDEQRVTTPRPCDAGSRRLCAAMLLLLPTVILGCRSPDKEEREPFTPALWKEALGDDQQRMKSQDEREREKPFRTLRAAGKVIADTVVGIYNYVTGDTPFNAVKEMLDPSFPDHRRRAVVYLSEHDYGRQEPYTKYYVEMARTDDDYLVRAISIRALNRARNKDKAAMAAYIRALDDKHDLVRLEAAKAVANMPDAGAVPALIRHMSDGEEHVDVRVACADALRSYHTSEVAQALVRVLRDRNFSVSWQARKSLNLMIGKDYRFDQAAWLDYLSGSAQLRQ